MSGRYELLDSGNFAKLEQVGEYKLVRPALNAAWAPSLDAAKWRSADAVFTRDSSGSGKWSYNTKLPGKWVAEYGGLMMQIKPTGFGHPFAVLALPPRFYHPGKLKAGKTLFGNII